MKKANKSIVPGDDQMVCYACGNYKSSLVSIEEHHIFGSKACRSKSDKYGLVVHLCSNCHYRLHNTKEGKEMKQHLHRLGQELFEERYGDRQKFIEEFIRSYL